jgi:hypothetical protein
VIGCEREDRDDADPDYDEGSQRGEPVVTEKAADRFEN